MDVLLVHVILLNCSGKDKIPWKCLVGNIDYQSKSSWRLHQVGQQQSLCQQQFNTCWCMTNPQTCVRNHGIKPASNKAKHANSKPSNCDQMQGAATMNHDPKADNKRNHKSANMWWAILFMKKYLDGKHNRQTQNNINYAVRAAVTVALQEIIWRH